MRSIIDAQQRYCYKTRVMFFYMLKYKKKMMMLSKRRVGIDSFDYWTRRLKLPNAIYVLYKTMHNINYNNNLKLLIQLRLSIRLKDNEKQYRLPRLGKRCFFMKKNNIWRQVPVAALYLSSFQKQVRPVLQCLSRIEWIGS